MKSPHPLGVETVFGIFTAESTLHLTRYAVIAGGFWVLFHVLLRRWTQTHLIHVKPRAPGQLLREILWSLQTFAVFGVVGVGVWSVREHTNLYLRLDRFESWYLPLSVLMMLVVHDTWFYWTHRIMHHPRLYRAWHKVHHDSRTPSPFTSFSFDTAESFVQAAIVPLCLMIFPVHPFAIAAFLAIMTFYNVYGHNMIEFYPRRWITRWWWPLNTATHHSHHHEVFRGNYGLYFLFWDRLMGTLETDGSESFSAPDQRTTQPRIGASSSSM